MNALHRPFTPTKNRRFNELIGFSMIAAALLLFLAFASYSPFDPSLNTASVSEGSPTHNWIGRVGAVIADLSLQALGIAVFALPVMLGMLGLRWFRSRHIHSPIEKLLGALTLLLFIPAFMGLLPGHLRWMHALAIEGVSGKLLADFLIHYFNLPGAYIVALSVISAALYLCTTFSFTELHYWLETRFTFVTAAWQRLQDWRAERVKLRAQKELERRKANRPMVTSQLLPAKKVPPAAQVSDRYESARPVKTGLEQMAESLSAVEKEGEPELDERTAEDREIEVGRRADSDTKRKTVLPKTHGTFQLPPSAMLKRPDEQYAIDEAELKEQAQILVEKCAEFDVHGHDYW